MVYETANLKTNDKLINEQINRINTVFQGKVPEGLGQLYSDSLMNLEGTTLKGFLINRLMPNEEYDRTVAMRHRLWKKLDQRNKK